MRKFLLALSLMLPAVALAQPIPVESDDLPAVASSSTPAPAVGGFTQLEPAPAAAAPNAAPAGAPAATPSAALPLAPVYADIIVSNVTVIVSNSTGLEREKALDIASRQALPQALAQMDPPVTGEKADVFISTQGDLTRYVKTVRIIKEVLVPTYTLTADLTFNGQMLYKNLGGRIPTVSGSIVSQGSYKDPRPKLTHEIQLTSGNPADQARLLRILNGLPNTKARYTSISTAEAAYSVETVLQLDELEQSLSAQNISTMPGPASGLRVSF